MSTERYLLYYTDCTSPIPICLGWTGEKDGTPIIRDPEEDYVELMETWGNFVNGDTYASENPERDYGFHVTANGTVINLRNLKVLVRFPQKEPALGCLN